MDTLIKAVLFDLDGTLADTLPDLADSANAVFAQYGYSTHSLEQYRYFVGHGVRQLIKSACNVQDETELNLLLASFMQIYNCNCLHKTTPYPKAQEVIQQLKKLGLHLAVITNKPNEQATKIVECFYSDCFEMVQGGTATSPRKPDPTVVLQTLNVWGISPEEAVFVGDSEVDVQTAQLSGTHFLGVTFGYRREDELKNAGAKYFISSYDQLVFAIGQWRLKGDNVYEDCISR